MVVVRPRIGDGRPESDPDSLASPFMRVIRHGDTGPEVTDVQRRLVDLGDLAPDSDAVLGLFDDVTHDGVRAFQQRRGLVADGLVGPDTWRVLVEAGFELGDRLLYQTRPMLRGDDVRELQERLGRLGFDAGQVDGIFGPETAAAVRDFQDNVGVRADGRVGQETSAALRRLFRSHQSVPAVTVTERHVGIRRRGVVGARVLVDPGNDVEDPGHETPDGVPEHVVTWEIARRVHGRLAALGASPVLSRGPATAPSSSARARQANRDDVDVILSIHGNGLETTQARGCAAYYYGAGSSVSERGKRLAGLAVTSIVKATHTVNCRTHASTASLLRESRAPAVMVEVGFLTHPEEGRLLATPGYQATIAECLTNALITWLDE